MPGYLVTADIEKTFDSVDHTFLCATLRKFGLYQMDPGTFEGSGELCDEITDSQPNISSLSSGTHQGNPLFAYLFILVMEILFIQIRNKRISEV